MGETMKGTKRLLTVEDAINMAEVEVEKLYKECVNPQFLVLLKLLGLNKRFIKAKGTKLWDDQNNEYIDFLGAYGALNVGHNHEEVIAALQQVSKYPNLLQTAVNPLASVLAQNLAEITPGDLKYTFFCNSGAEAVEGALKLAKIATGKSRIIYCRGSFHGKSMGALSITGREKYKKYFGPLVPMATEVTFGDTHNLEATFKQFDDIAAFIMEPIQGEAGIVTPPVGYLKKVKELCQKYQILLIADEVQTGFGRTGKWFACQEEGIAPDILCMAKSLGGGIMPIGAYIANEDTWKRGYGSIDKCLLHTSTFGGNTWACTAGITTINIIEEAELHEAAKEKGDYFIKKLQGLKEKYPLLRDVRGRGLMIGIEFGDLNYALLNKIVSNSQKDMIDEYTGGMIASQLANDYQIITAYTLNNPNVIRIEPPLTISYEEIDYFINSLQEILKKNNRIGGMAFKTLKNLFHSYKESKEA
ncbi:aspartate aminotransferase family protein [Alkaliphilus hydrothermalis]|uniref:Putrescine aminotransferase n=1 Tax=Alkaliphilus hydrothermalis TaxID=1482730 RepID=A0ABS2NTD0_9FIRM|nr:aspartate aminotransferase family protein [Alkaliphilus hydrothermalis]MBM7616186.1 putrescine aminotransferase [Alkaliphilus hydrothermalis]